MTTAARTGPNRWIQAALHEAGSVPAGSDFYQEHEEGMAPIVSRAAHRLNAFGALATATGISGE